MQPINEHQAPGSYQDARAESAPGDAESSGAESVATSSIYDYPSSGDGFLETPDSTIAFSLEETMRTWQLGPEQKPQAKALQGLQLIAGRTIRTLRGRQCSVCRSIHSAHLFDGGSCPLCGMNAELQSNAGPSNASSLSISQEPEPFP